MALVNDQAIVLRSFPFGEADRVVIMLSPNRGKLRTVAKGVRKTKSRFGGRLEPFTHVDVVLYEGRSLDTITQVSVIEVFPRLRADLDRLMAAGAMAEVADIVAQEDESSVRLFLLMLRGLKALEMDRPFHPDFVTAFRLKAAGVVGMAPALDACAGCGTASGLTRFSFAEGGALCERCRTAGAYALRAGLVAYLAELVAADLGALPSFDPSFGPEAQGVARRFLEYHLERRLAGSGVVDV